jgi:hypothetical protein
MSNNTLWVNQFPNNIHEFDDWSVMETYPDKFMQGFLHDILIYSRTLEEHEEHFRLVCGALGRTLIMLNSVNSHFPILYPLPRE